MKLLLTFFLVLGAHFSATALVPGEQKAWLGWPFDKSSKPVFTFLQNNLGATLTQLLSVIAAACFIAAIFAVYDKFVPTDWLPYLLIIGAVASSLLFVMYIGIWSIVPIIINGVIIYGYINKFWEKI